MSRAADVTARFLARHASRAFPSATLADELDAARALVADADDELDTEADTAAALALYDDALRALASGDAQDSHLSIFVERVRCDAMARSSAAALALGDAEAALSRSHAAYASSVFDEDLNRVAMVLRANYEACMALNNDDIAASVISDALRRGCDVDCFPRGPLATRAAEDVGRRAVPLDRFIALVMRLNRTEEDRARIESALEMINQGAMIDARDEDGNNMLWGALAGCSHAAADDGVDAGENVVRVVHMLLDAGARANQRYEYGSTPLILAARSGVVGAVDALLGAGAEIDARDEGGRTALIAACQIRDSATKDDTRVIERLLDSRVSTEARDANGLTALHYACKLGNDAAVETLLSRGADWRARTPAGESPVMLGYLKARASGVVADILKHVEHLADDDERAIVEETELFRRATGATSASGAAVRCVKDDLALVKWCEREKEISKSVAKALKVDYTHGKIFMLAHDTELTEDEREEVTAIYLDACGFELDEANCLPMSVAVTLYRKYGDVLQSFVKFNQAAFPVSLRESYEDETYDDSLPPDFVSRALFAREQVAGAPDVGVPSTLAPTSLRSPLFVAFESMMIQSVERAFCYAPLIPERARAWLLNCESFVAVARAGAYTAARLRDDLSLHVDVVLVTDDESKHPPACFVDDATVVTASRFSLTSFDVHSQKTLFVACEPNEAGVRLLERATDAYTSVRGAHVVAAFAHRDDASCASVLKARGFVEDEPKRSMSFTASGRPYVFTSWTT
jgi:hypothetical protein